MTEPTLRTSARRPWLAGLAAFNAFGAWYGGVGLVTCGMDFGESINERLPFDGPVLAGLALGIIVGIPLTMLAWSAWTGGPRTDDLALAVGLVLIGWIIVQVAVIRAYSFFQPAYLAIGAAFVAASHRVTLNPVRRGVLFVAVGSVLTAVGVGLLPYPIKNGLTTVSVVAVGVLLPGLALVGFGAVSALRGRRSVSALAGGESSCSSSQRRCRSSRRPSPAYSEMIRSSNPFQCVSPLATIWGSNVEFRSRGMSMGVSPSSVLRVLGVVPL